MLWFANKPKITESSRPRELPPQSLTQPDVNLSVQIFNRLVGHSEIMHSRSGNPGLTEKYPRVVAFIFGLLHGFGFAGALSQIGLPQSSIPTALLFFNVGVESGQLFFIACVFSIITLGGAIISRISMPRMAWVSTVPPYFIGSAAAFWTIQRLVDF